MMRGNRSFVPALRFRALSRLYDPVVRVTTREQVVKQAVVEAAAPPRAAIIVDVGCGTGTLTIACKQAYPDARMIGVDLDSGILDLARRKAARSGVDVLFLEADATCLPLPDGVADRVVSSLFFHHLSAEGKRRALLECLRVLDARGRLIVADWGKPANFLMQGLFYPIRLLDGFSNTAANVQGLLAGMVRDAGAREVRALDRFSTVFGTLELLGAQKFLDAGIDL